MLTRNGINQIESVADNTHKAKQIEKRGKQKETNEKRKAVALARQRNGEG